MVECDIHWEVHPTGRDKADQNLPLTIPVQLGRHVVMILLDTGISVSMIRAHLVSKNRPILRWTAIVGVNQQVCKWPRINLILYYDNRAHTFEILKLEDLPFPVVLGRDAPGFGSLVRVALLEVTATNEEKVDEGEGTANTFPDTAPTGEDWTIDPTFLWAQKADISLWRLWDNQAVIEGVPGDPPLGRSVSPPGSVTGSPLAGKGPYPPGGTEQLQLVVTQTYRTQVLQQAHGHSWARHQGRALILRWILEIFFGPVYL